MDIVYWFAAGSALYFGVRAFLLFRRYRQKENDRAQPDFAEKLAQAKAMTKAAGEARSELPEGLVDLVKEAYENTDYYEERRAEIKSVEASGDLFGYGYLAYSGYRNMAEFALRHLTDDDMLYSTESSGRQVKWTVDKLVYFARWAYLKDYVILQIIDYVKVNTWGRFATDRGQARSASIAAKLQDYRATAAETRLNLQREKGAVSANPALSEHDKEQQIRDLDAMADNELRRVRGELGIPESSASASEFQRKLMARVKKLRTMEEAKAALRKEMAARPDQEEAIEELIDDIDSGDWESWD